MGRTQLVSKPTIVGDNPNEGLVFHFVNERPIDADELGKLFVSLARDYRRLTQRKLVVARVEVGSLTAILMDSAIAAGPYLANAAEVAKAVNGAISFSRALKNLYEQARNPRAKTTTSRSPGQASLKQFLRVIEKSGGEGQFEYSSKTEKFKVHVTSGEAREIRERAKAEQPLEVAGLPALPGAGDTRGIVDRLSSISESDVAAVIPVLVSTMRSAGLEYLLDMIVNELTAQGHYRIAEAIRTERAKPRRGVLPPITRS
jgi:hypothetical protein